MTNLANQLRYLVKMHTKSVRNLKKNLPEMNTTRNCYDKFSEVGKTKFMNY